MFAGPNGSGKSTLRDLLDPALIGVYVNADEIAKSLRSSTGLDLDQFGDRLEFSDLCTSLKAHPFYGPKVALVVEELKESAGCLQLPMSQEVGYLAAGIADFVRHKLIQARTSFSFETVMSSADKVHLLAEAQRLGFRTYLYYIATEDPEINISRVASRVRLGGHDVPKKKIVERYNRSLGLLPDAIRSTNRAFIFDNSSDGSRAVWIAEITDGSDMELKTSDVPAWFDRYVLGPLTN